MHEDDESEPDNPVEILEKKRQREIEVCECRLSLHLSVFFLFLTIPFMAGMEGPTNCKW